MHFLKKLPFPFLLAVLLATDWLSASGAYLQNAGPGSRPNIIFIMADDLGYADLGSYGQEQIQTPHLDGMAAEGIRFTQAYAGSPVCAPSRSVLMTGLHNGHGRIRDNIPHGVFLKPDDLTVAEVLKQAGYRTGAIGKWSLGNPGSWGVPLYQGFDEWYGHLNQDQAHFYYPDYLWENDQVVLLPGNRGESRQEYTADLFTKKAVDFIRTNQQRSFFLYLAYTLPHWSDFDRDTPESQIVPSDEPYSDRDWPQVEKNYAAMVTRLDTYVGRILRLLTELGIDQNTIVFFTSDNGPSAEGLHNPEFFDSNGPLRGFKRDIYEGAIRIPMIVRWPGTIEEGRVSDQVWAFWDFLPTAAELAGLTPPEEIDGVSIVPTLLGNSQVDHEYLYWDYGHVRETFKQAIRQGRWKGVRVGVRSDFELYDLQEDVSESRNVARNHPEIVRRLEKLMKEAREDVQEYPIRELSQKNK